MASRKPATRIQRAGNGHSYVLDNEKVPGVTTILSRGIPKPALVNWAAGTVADFVVNNLTTAKTPDGRTRIVADELVAEARAWNATRSRPEKIGDEPLPRLPLSKILKDVRYKDLDEASGKGTAVHGLAERLARGQEVEVPELLAGHVDSYLRFLEEWDPHNALLERVVVSRRWGYMGKLDLIADFPGVWPAGTPWEGEPVGRALLDIKTSRSGIYAETALQLAGYRYAETMLDGEGEVPMPTVDWAGAVWVRADGYDVYRMAADEKAFRILLYAKHVGDWLDFREGAAATVKSDSLPAPEVDRGGVEVSA